ncbi:glycerophosphoryl diester phosphodiesterase membrane domain-containing protein [Clostridium pasteurianum]|uniref:glycerophosphoryl diester phosphodiesterase membrane domain-containing protein n=1 Tax=Clostridium pasteurianum TaxID=1501 RepID=UPI002260A36A|nr:glycerophosphoryl diester phosphodiesterase membrane domain-containing protein [Clostridium pasteurianum]UZW13017.1 glycerophosphoryl diester phosphodiesterase membrane domain-containing protein [Clostridium pasteurianum]
MNIMNLSEIMDRSIEILKKYIKTIILFNLAYGVISFIAVVVLFVIGIILMFLFRDSLTSPIIFGIIFSILSLLGVSFFLSTNIGMIKISSQDFLGGKVYADEAIKISFRYIFKVFAIVICVFILFIPVMAILGAIIYYAYKGNELIFNSFDFYNPIEITLIITSVIILLVTAIIFLSYITWIIFSLHTLVIEKQSIFTSIKRSFQLVKGDFWKILGCIIIFSLSTFVIRLSLDSFLAVILSIFYMLLKFLSVEGDYVTFMGVIFVYARWPLSILSWLVISPVVTIMISLLYFNQRFKKEGYDILLKLKKIQQSEERNRTSESTEFNDTI